MPFLVFVLPVTDRNKTMVLLFWCCGRCCCGSINFALFSGLAPFCDNAQTGETLHSIIAADKEG